MNQPPIVVLADDVDQITSKSVEAIGDHLEQLGEFATIGGLATFIRLTEIHRLTEDVDTVSPDRAQAIELLLRSGATPLDHGFLLNGEIPVDIINVPDPVSDSTPPLHAARRWGFDNSSLVEVRVSGPNPVSATLPVSNTSALICMKAHALHYRDDPYKRATDTLDIASLVDRCDLRELAATLASAPGPLPSSTLFHLHSAFVTHAEVTLTHGRLYANATQTVPLPPRQVEQVAEVVSNLAELGVSLPTLDDMRDRDRGVER